MLEVGINYMRNKKVLGMPIVYSICVLLVILIGIFVGSFCDYDINFALANKTEIGRIYASYGMSFAYCLYPAAGMCLFKYFKKKNDGKYASIAWILLIIAYFLAVYYSNLYMGSKIREALGYSESEHKFLISLLTWFIWVLVYSWVPVLFYFVLDDSKSDALLVIGIAILVSGILSDCVNVWLKQVASRPRYKYLITLDDPKSEYRNWWEMIPNVAGSNDNFKSWPSGNMAISAMMFSLPLLASVLKNHKNYFNVIAFAIAAVYVGVYAYNRIHMTNHFLSDTCFGTLFTYLIFAGISIVLEKSLKNDN